MPDQPQYTPEERRQHREDCERNAGMLQSRIDDLLNRYNLDLGGAILETVGFVSTDYRGFWSEAKEITDLFRETRPLRRDAREQLWSRFQDACNVVRNNQGMERFASEGRAEVILSRVRDVHGPARSAMDRDAFQEGVEALKDAMGMLKESHLFRADRERVWAAYCEARDALQERQREVQSDNQQRLMSDVHEAQGLVYENPYDARDRVREIQADLRDAYLTREQRDEVREALDRVWRAASEGIAGIREEKARKHQEWVRRQEELIERWEESIDRQREFISRMEDQIANLEDRIAAARNEDFIADAEGWIREKYEKIRDAQERVADLERRTEDVRGRLRQ